MSRVKTPTCSAPPAELISRTPLGHLVDAGDRDDRTEDLVAQDGHLRAGVHEQGRLDERVVPAAAADQPRALADGLVDHGLHAAGRRVVDEGADLGLGQGGVAGGRAATRGRSRSTSASWMSACA
jgi:hypothetical protein